jgi:SAM-dependent methyltransferase
MRALYSGQSFREQSSRSIGEMSKFSTLEELGLGLSGDDLSRALRPFLYAGPESEAEQWQHQTARRRRKILKKSIKYLAGGWGADRERSTERVRKEYDTAWSVGHERYDPARPKAKFTPWLWREKRILFNAAGAPRFRLLIYAAVIEQLKPKRVLEVGSGDGINLLMLAGAFTEISFTGLELTKQGLAAARTVQRLPHLPEPLRGYSPLPERDKSAFQGVEFVQGNASAMPFTEGAFDLVMTVLAVEQMERVRVAALAEISRVAGKYILNLEPFHEVNASVFRRLNVRLRDYFRGSIDELPNYGLKPLWATADFPQEVLLGAALVLSRKQ